jgi:hypothetical protein
MMIFLVAGIVYLIGVGVVLTLRPELMFTPDGRWKEFGIGQDRTYTTPFPFWVFCLVWALVSYGVSLLVCSLGEGSRQNRRWENARYPGPAFGAQEEIGGPELPQGYYMLNRKTKNGIPRYIYIGPDPE